MQRVRVRIDPYTARHGGNAVVYVNAALAPVDDIPVRTRCMMAREHELAAQPELAMLMVERVRRALLNGDTPRGSAGGSWGE